MARDRSYEETTKLCEENYWRSCSEKQEERPTYGKKDRSDMGIGPTGPP